mgnify:CR=1 FL=1
MIIIKIEKETIILKLFGINFVQFLDRNYIKYMRKIKKLRNDDFK